MLEREVIKVLYNVLCALNFLHSTNLMHRDLKPSNILVRPDCSVVLCDFGITRPDSIAENVPKLDSQHRKLQQVINDLRSSHEISDSSVKRTALKVLNSVRVPKHSSFMSPLNQLNLSTSLNDTYLPNIKDQ